MRARAALLALAALGVACSSGLPTPEARRAAAKLEELEARVLQLQRQAAVNELELVRLRQQVAELEARAGGPPAPRGEAAAPQRPFPAPLPPAGSAQAGADLEEADLDLLPPQERPPAPAVGAPPAPLPPPPRPAETPSPLLPEAAPSREDPLPPVTREGQLFYDQGYTLYHQGRYVEAEARFREFLAQHPATELSDNAQYWIGASMMAREDLLGALAAFRLTVERYPRGNKVPDALLKIGECLEALGDEPGAVEIYQELSRRFPFSAAAALAEERLDLLE